jgi:hypothetical protein
MPHHLTVDAPAGSAEADPPSDNPSSSALASPSLNRRELATLRAIASGHAEISCSRAPDLFIDGLACCDQSTARHLATLGFVTAAHEADSGTRVPAVLTEAGKHALETVNGNVLVA